MADIRAESVVCAIEGFAPGRDSNMEIKLCSTCLVESNHLSGELDMATFDTLHISLISISISPFIYTTTAY